MVKLKSVLVVGFNTRPLAYSLYKAGYQVYAVDFFGDLDLYPNVHECLIVTKKLGANYNYHLLKDKYSEFLASFSIELLRKHPNINYLIIGSGLDDNYNERKSISDEIRKKEYNILNANNNLESIKEARDIKKVYNFLKSGGYDVPNTEIFKNSESQYHIFKFPFILKRRTGSGGINVNKIENESDLIFFIKRQEAKSYNLSDWLIQDYIEGVPVSCTIISNGNECEVISINRQIIGSEFVNVPKEFMYCGNIVPANLLKDDNKLISEISIILTKNLGLKGINGFDFVLKNHYPFLMEINPRIPGSIRVSETALNLNLLDLHIQSFYPEKWKDVKKLITSIKPKCFASKLIMFAPKEIDITLIERINRLKYVHDKSEPVKKILKDEPLCTVLFQGQDFAESYFGALKIIDEIKRIIELG